MPGYPPPGLRGSSSKTSLKIRPIAFRGFEMDSPVRSRNRRVSSAMAATCGNCNVRADSSPVEDDADADANCERSELFDRDETKAGPAVGDVGSGEGGSASIALSTLLQTRISMCH